ncbi:uncharacterized protein LOC142545591 isoform X2 [Primulina tabacum]|uniref:uncharacterized protein LOC142545591 isoform X2 n=1 Tax=Primulina tabacum TaxID=48773 RepID=UPI003F5971D6
MANRLKEDEKNERIIRNLLKLPENRRCINCNSLGPQYVCTNFSTFICTTCSGIHREFTHRVKSVSMAKFTPQEVSSLQGGGNASAREIYLKEWDSQRNSLPDASNIERLRDFIKHIYVDRRYTGERNSEKPLRAKMGETEDFSGNKRIDNNQGGSRSPTYEETFERRQDRASVGGRSPGYDQDNKQTADYRRSPLCAEVVNDWKREDRFGNGRRSDDGNSDGSSKFGGRSPDNQRDSDMSSPPVVRPVRDILGENVTPLRVIEPPPKVSGGRSTDGSAHTQRTASSSNLASSEGNPSVIKVEASFIDFDPVPEPVVAATIPQTHHSATNAAPVQQIASTDNNWANFDSFPEVKFPTPVSNSVESLLSELSIEVSTSGPPAPAAAPASKLSPFLSSGSEGSSLGSTYGSLAPQSLFPSDGTSSFANTPTGGGQWAILNSHQNSMFPGANGLSVPQPVATISATSSDKLNPLVGPISHGHPGAVISQSGQAISNPSMGSAFGFSSESALGERSGGRSELPADLFTMTNSYFLPPVSGWYSGSPYVARGPKHYNMTMAVPNFQQVPRSTNPFDSTNERPVPATTFPSGASLHGSVAKSAPASGLLRASSLGTPFSFPSSMHTQPPPFAQSIPPTPFFGQELSGSTAHRPFGPNQQFGGLHSAHSAPGNFTSTDGNPFG